VVYLLATAAALTSALGGVLQRMGVESAPADSAMRLRLLTHALRHGVWLAGFGLLLVTFVLQATALRFGELSAVQPVLTTELLFVIAILALFFHHKLRWRDWGGAIAIVVGLASFLAFAAPKVGHSAPDSRALGVVSITVFAGAVLLVVAGSSGPRWWRAVALGAAAAVLFAYTASLTKATTTLITHGWGHVLLHWEPYALVATGAFGFFLLQNALHAGPIAASRAAMVIVNPIVSIAIGLIVFADHLRTGSMYLAREILGLCVLFVGALVLTQSPLVSGAGKEGAPGEMLGRNLSEVPVP
jgi:drug/metabolite transporter (DMT)-like permease